ncbi:MAG: hypothetical protein K2N38_05740 [Oscillospiraceae bacterium]|nr:hypothetical protein [Oscillospiraceae bacterium]
MIRNTFTYHTEDNSAEFVVNISVPDEVSETVKQQKIERLYDILKPKNDDNDSLNAA